MAGAEDRRGSCLRKWGRAERYPISATVVHFQSCLSLAVDSPNIGASGGRPVSFWWRRRPWYRQYSRGSPNHFLLIPRSTPSNFQWVAEFCDKVAVHNTKVFLRADSASAQTKSMLSLYFWWIGCQVRTRLKCHQLHTSTHDERRYSTICRHWGHSPDCGHCTNQILHAGHSVRNQAAVRPCCWRFA